MKTTILLLFLLGSAQSLPIQINHALALAPLNLVPDQATLNHLQSNQVFPSLSLIPLTQVLTLGSDLQLLNSPAGIAPGTQTFPLSLGALNGPQQHLQPQMLPVIVGQLGAQGTLLSSEELPAASPLLTGLIFQPLLQGAILPNSQINPAHNRILPAGQAKPKPAIHGNTEGPFPTPSDIDDDFGVTAPAGIQRGLRFTEETTTESP